MTQTMLDITVALHTPEGRIETPMRISDESGQIGDAIAQGLQLGLDENGFWVRNWADYQESFPTADAAARAWLEEQDVPPLDRHIRRYLLRYPNSIKSRQQALAAIFTGSTMVWKDGLVIDTCEKPVSEAILIAQFFHDIENLHDSANITVERAMRQMRLDNLTSFVKASNAEPHIRLGAFLWEHSLADWPCMNIPEDAEKSYRAGAIEFLRLFSFQLRMARKHIHPAGASLIAYLCEQTADQTRAMRKILAEIEDHKEAQERVPFEPLERQRSRYCLPLREVGDFKALTKKEYDHPGKKGDALFEALEELPGVHSVEYDGHFGAAIFYHVDAEEDCDDTHERVASMVRDHVVNARAVLEQSAKDDAS